MAVGPAVAWQHVLGQSTAISASVVGSTHQPRSRNSWHGVPCMSSPAHEGAAVGADETGEAVGPDVVGVVVGIEVGWCVQPEQVTTQTSRHWLFNGSLQSVLALEIMYIPAQYAADSVSW